MTDKELAKLLEDVASGAKSTTEAAIAITRGEQTVSKPHVRMSGEKMLTEADLKSITG